MTIKFEVEYMKGKENIVADCLSRRVADDTSSFLTITTVPADWLKKLQTQLATDPYLKKLDEDREAGHLDAAKYAKRGRLLYYKGIIFLCPSSPFTTTIISEHHDTPMGGH